MMTNQVHCIYNVKMVDGDHVHDVFVSESLSLIIDLFIDLADGCLEPLPDQIDYGWKSAESYFVYQETKYYLLTRYSCHKEAKFVNSSSTMIEIECRKDQWQNKTIAKCQINKE